MQLFYQSSLSHSGIKGMKWGKRRYQNKDGSLTSAGKIRYGSTKSDQWISKSTSKPLASIRYKSTKNDNKPFEGSGSDQWISKSTSKPLATISYKSTKKDDKPFEGRGSDKRISKSTSKPLATISYKSTPVSSLQKVSDKTKELIKKQYIETSKSIEALAKETKAIEEGKKFAELKIVRKDG